MPCGKIWKLKRWIYGSRPPANAWEKDFAEKLTNAGVEQGKSCPICLLPEKALVAGWSRSWWRFHIRIVGRRDSQATGRHEELVRRYDMKVRGILGGGSSDDEEVTILGRRLRWRKGTRIMEYEADDKYVKEVVKEMNSKVLTHP